MTAEEYLAAAEAAEREADRLELLGPDARLTVLALWDRAHAYRQSADLLLNCDYDISRAGLIRPMTDEEYRDYFGDGAGK
jgi:hypothetical protein